MILEEYPILKKAPVTEALIDIRVKLLPEFDVANINTIYESIKTRYPEKQEQKISEVKFEPRAEEIVKSSKPEINGYRYFSSDKKLVTVPSSTLCSMNFK